MRTKEQSLQISDQYDWNHSSFFCCNSGFHTLFYIWNGGSGIPSGFQPFSETSYNDSEAFERGHSKPGIYQSNLIVDILPCSAEIESVVW